MTDRVRHDAGFGCMECGRRFRTVKSAERAQSEGCPGCGGSDIDLVSQSHYEPLKQKQGATP